MLKRGKNNSKNMVFFHLSRFINIDHFETLYITKNKTLFRKVKILQYMYE